VLTSLERELNTHDLALPIPLGGTQDGLFRLIVMSSTDLKPQAQYMERVERLYHQTGGRDVGIVFLMDETSSEQGVRNLMLLQAT